MLQEKSNSYSKNIYWVFGILLKIQNFREIMLYKNC